MGKQKNAESPKKEADRVKFLTDSAQLAIPIGSLFQAEVPEWIGVPNKHHPCDKDDASDTSRWLGTKSWPIEGSSITNSDADKIGKGRPDSCSCTSPGSAKCVKFHIQEKSAELQQDLGPAFRDWNFHTMGEEAVLRSWTAKEQRKFETLVKGHPPSQHKSFLKPAMEAFPSKSRKDIVSYYCNVFVPRRISKLTRAGCKTIDSDDDEPSEIINSKTSRKRCQADSTSSSSKQVKTPFLRGHR
ncbi:hypothetical protein AAG906_032550 [Vitis piasezkii]|uniref:AT-rich interactive domain-containing protein 2-like n=1 Tax=Vitis riparia TaxID=96939 RepID=UPI00155B3E6C|nr:AT-rich interactive domain-containing protein 2-like [Vitis riparia]